MNGAPVALPPIEVDPGLAEEAVVRAVRGHRLEPRYRLERERCYGIADPDDREAAFRCLDRRLVAEIGLDDPIREALAARPAVATGVARVAIARAPARRAEGADLFAGSARASAGTAPALGIALTPETLADPPRLRLLLEIELLHIDDLLDPSFGFDPGLTLRDGSPGRLPLLHERYRLLWRTSVLGRLDRQRQRAGDERRHCSDRLQRAFPRPAGLAASLLARLFDGPRPSHPELVALSDGGPGGSADGRPVPGSRCPLCSLPSFGFEPDPAALPVAIQREIQADVPGWRPALGICRQCADIYRAAATPSR